jgi:hypothetical protein
VLLLLLFAPPAGAQQPGSSSSSTSTSTTIAKDPLDQPFRSPNYLLHATGHGTMNGPVKDDWWFLYPGKPNDKGFVELPDGEGGTFTYSIDQSSGPYSTGRPVCGAMAGKLKPGAAMGEWGGPVTFVCVKQPATTTTTGKGSSTSSGAGTTTATEPAPVCNVHGRVVDARGAGVPDIHVRVQAGKLELDAATDASGEYSFAEIGDDPAGGTFDSRRDAIVVTLLTEDWGHDPRRFRVLDDPTLGRLETPPFRIVDVPTCEQNFDLRAPDPRWIAVAPSLGDWPAIVEIYQNVHRAWAYADQLGLTLDYGLPLPVRAWCVDARLGCDDFTRAGGNGAFFAGSTSNGSSVTGQPYIAFGTRESRFGNPGAPDNREYHEFGHFVLAAILGNALPAARGSVNHAGVWNPTTTDSWVEGFAEFYSLMVGKYVEGKAYDRLYRVDMSDVAKLHPPVPNPYGSTVLDLGQDWTVWEFEELALASLLWQLQSATVSSAPQVRAPRRLDTLGYAVVQDPSYGPLLVGRIENRTPADPDQPWTGASIGTNAMAVFVDAAGKTVDTVVGATIPADVGAGRQALVVLPVKPGLAYDQVALTAYEGRPPTPEPTPPPLSVSAAELISLLARTKSAKPQANGHVWDVQDVYTTLKDSYAGQGTVVEGLDTIDQLMIRHGFHENVDGDNAWEPGEAIGLTSRRGGTEADCTEDQPDPACKTAQIPRTDLPLPESMVATVATNVSDALVAVHVRYPDRPDDPGFGFTAKPDADGKILVPVPPAKSKAQVVLTAVADRHQPTVLGTIDAARFWEQASGAPDTPFLSFRATLPASDTRLPAPLPDRAEPARRAAESVVGDWWEQPGWAGWLATVALVGALVVFARRAAPAGRVPGTDQTHSRRKS